jgi:hypothetical protein
MKEPPGLLSEYQPTESSIYFPVNFYKGMNVGLQEPLLVIVCAGGERDKGRNDGIAGCVETMV